MSTEILQNIRELQNALTVARLNYEIWWVYKEKESRKRYVDTLNTYPLFFSNFSSCSFCCDDRLSL